MAQVCTNSATLSRNYVIPAQGVACNFAGIKSIVDIMKTTQFKTNINCSACVANVTPYLSGAEKIEHWEVDTTNPEKILTIEGGEGAEKEAIKLVEKAGYRIEKKSGN